MTQKQQLITDETQALVVKGLLDTALPAIRQTIEEHKADTATVEALTHTVAALTNTVSALEAQVRYLQMEVARLAAKDDEVASP